MVQRIKDVTRAWPWLIVAVVFWCLLWGTVDLRTVLGGLVAAVIVFVLFPLPANPRELTIRPIPVLVLVATFLWDLMVSAGEVAWYTVRPAPQPPSSVIAVQLASRSDFFLTFTGVLCTLVPGSVVVEAQRATGTLFMHNIGAGTEAEVEAARQDALKQEGRLLRAFARREVLEGAGLS